MSRGRRNGTVQVLALGTTFGLELRNEVQPPFQREGDLPLVEILSERRRRLCVLRVGLSSRTQMSLSTYSIPHPQSETPDDRPHWRKACPLSYVWAFRMLHESD